jgi:hypothetical protein
MKKEPFPKWPRREVLRVGLAAAAGLSPALNSAGRLLATGAPSALPQELPSAELELGYLEGSQEWLSADGWPAQLPADGSLVAGALPPRVLPAASLAAGDPGFANRRVALQVHGLYPRLREREWPEFRRISLAAILPAPAGSPAPEVRVAMWTSSRVERVFNLAAPNRMGLPVGPGGELELSLEVEQRRRVLIAERGRTVAGASGPSGNVRGASATSASSGEARPTLEQWLVDRYRSRLTVDGWAGQPKLRRGFYLLAVAPGALQGPRTLSGRPLRRIGRSLLLSFDATP